MKPGDAEWTRLITASKVAAIIGVAPSAWTSARALWHEMRGDVERPTSNDSQRRGHYLEAGVLAWWDDQHPDLLAQSPRSRRTFRLGDWAAAEPDGCLWTDDVPREIRPDGIARPGVLVEAKTASDMDEWGQPGTDQIPAYYLSQCYWQLHVSGAARCYVPVLGPFLRFSEYVVERDDEVGALLEAECRAFYESLAGDEPPSLDDSPATYEVLRRLHRDIDRGESVEIDDDLAYDLVNYSAEIKDFEVRLRHAKTVVLERMGRAQYATYQGVRIARRQPFGDDVRFVVTAKPSDLPDTEGIPA